MKKLKNILIAACFVSVLSCDDYTDINNSPNNPSEENVTPELILSAAIVQPYRTFVTTANELGNVWTDAWAGNVNNITGAYSPEYSLQMSTSFRQGIWNNFFLYTANLTNIINYDSEDYNDHKAISKIMKVYYFQYLVDLYGDIPYTEAHNASILTPVYDDDMAVYRDLYVQLDEAIALINGEHPVTTLNVGAEDPVFAGDMAQWEAFANTLKLRLLIRESELAETNGESDAYLTSKFAELSSATFVTSDVVINPGFTNVLNRQNPFFGAFGEDVSGNFAAGFNLVRATDNIVDLLQTSNDLRLTRLFAEDAAGSGTYTGVRQGETDPNVVPDDLSPLGPGLVISSEQDGYLMLGAESFFLQSEAVFRGRLTGDAQALFNQGITASYVNLGLSAAEATTYIANSDLDPGVGWSATADKLEAIITQKWIANIGTNGIESYIEYTRTGYPVTQVSLLAITPTGDLPKRLLYPATEYSGNTANVPALTLAQTFTQGPFWYVP
ncbi:MAG: SusD/RagB family nutrient-binding outer membrane lipoprotein [Flavobacterium sp.]|uniref:SusD/RagB family nutrient-binding outer membrane lipoprotein n=1 Tax=Flavobacterium sp. TaxID=239 RepID=UPI0011FEC8B1|nr:SusD/RagB family nutrient-binding outer membrane lipoprotein [Flavobacterium sp.]RZJ64292.1 MAG: SusD/RagB family nutrient-binding outer membrane lipoprotein [Flavobacterium sp.]